MKASVKAGVFVLYDWLATNLPLVSRKSYRHGVVMLATLRLQEEGSYDSINDHHCCHRRRLSERSVERKRTIGRQIQCGRRTVSAVPLGEHEI